MPFSNHSIIKIEQSQDCQLFAISRGNSLCVSQLPDLCEDRKFSTANNISISSNILYYHDSDMLIYSYNLETDELNKLSSYQRDIRRLVAIQDDILLILDREFNSQLDLKTLILKEVKKPTFETPTISQLSLNNELLYTAGLDRKIRIWNVDSLEMTKELLGHNSDIKSFIVFKNDELIASGDQNNTIIIWNIQDAKEIMIIASQSRIIFSLKVANKDRYLVAAGNNKIIEV